MTTQHNTFCDPETGLCTPAPVEGTAADVEFRDDMEIIYVGDPMCSWCWGISPHLNQLQRRAAKEGIPYRIVLGGLRPGGGDPWNEQFKEFLKHHWEEVHARSGQPFGYELFERDSFDYDTEPPCRAVVAAREMDASVEARFFELVQYHFYVRNQDPATLEFYRPICKELNLDFDKFTTLFQSEAIKQATLAEFQLNRQWGVQGYPTVVLRKEDKLYAIARGYAEFEQLWGMVESVMGRAVD